MKQINYTVRIRSRKGMWNEDNVALVPDFMTITDHAKQMIEKRNKVFFQNDMKDHKQLFVLARQMPKAYITKIFNWDKTDKE